MTIHDGYVSIHRTWKKGDAVVLRLPMPVRRVVAHAGVKDDEGRAALQRGPLVYAFEGVDNGGTVSGLTLPRGAKLTSEFRPDLLGGVAIISGTAGRAFVAVPYYAWDNRGQGEMAVWVGNGR